MEQGTHENKDNVENLSQVNGGTSDCSTCSNVNSSNYTGNNVVVLNPEKVVSAGEEAGALIADIRGLESSKRVVDQERSDGKEISELVNGEEVVLEMVTVIMPGENSGSSGGKKDLATKSDELGLEGALSIPEICDGGSGNGKALRQVARRSQGEFGKSANGVVLETMIVINSEENASTSRGNRGLEFKGNGLEMGTATVDNSKTKVSKEEKSSCVVDVKCVGGGGGGYKDNLNGEHVCRICHLSSEGLLESTDTSPIPNVPSMDLIQLGCGCKDELGIAHAYCAEVWFKLKGNRTCEICGEMAKNITGVGNSRFMEGWNHRRFVGNGSGSSERGGGCWRGQPFCNFLMACLVVAFVLPWFLRANMF